MCYAKYGKEQVSHTYLNGHMWHKVTYLAPWTHFTLSGPVTVQGLHTSVWTAQNGHFVAVQHVSRQVSMF